MNTSHASVMPDVTRRTLSQTIPSEETLLLLLAVEDTNKQISLPTLLFFIISTNTQLSVHSGKQ